MAYWLMKSRTRRLVLGPASKKGAKGDAWTGVRNYTASRT